MKFPDLDALASVVGISDIQLCDSVAIVGTQHLLETTGSLARKLFDVGLPPTNLYLLGKVYSTHESTAETIRSLGATVFSGSSPAKPGTFAYAIREDARSLWAEFLRNFRRNPVSMVIVLDDGGSMRATIPSIVREKCKVVGIEQTTFGIGRHPLWNDNDRLPVINVASTAAKRVYETPMIIAAILRRAKELVINSSGRCGIVGLGKIGLELFRELDRKGFDVHAFDRNEERMEMVPTLSRAKSAQDCVAKAEFVFGCVGGDGLEQCDLTSVSGPCSFASCSSGDVEFQSLLTGELQWTRQGRICPDLLATNTKSQLKVLRSGFPINFDNSNESVPAKEIQLTRGLLLAAVLQARALMNHPPIKAMNRTMMLLPKYQQAVVRSWAQSSGRLDLSIKELDWFESESKGVLIEIA